MTTNSRTPTEIEVSTQSELTPAMLRLLEDVLRHLHADDGPGKIVRNEVQRIVTGEKERMRRNA